MPSVRKTQASSVQGRTAARPDRVDAPVDQGRDGKGIGDRESDIADIEQRRMDREAEILQQRVEIHGLRAAPAAGAGRGWRSAG